MGDRLSTPQAERRTGATRWALLRAHKAGALQAQRDNRGRWWWDSDDLTAWLTTREQPDPPPAPVEAADRFAALVERAARAEGVAEGLRAALMHAESRAERAEAEAERWREQARQRRRWWPWG